MEPSLEPNDRLKAQLMTARDLGRTLDRMARQIVELMDPEVADPLADEGRGLEGGSGGDGLALIGMQTRGVYLARRLQQRIQDVEGLDVPVGVLDATMYRDDVRLRRHQPRIRTTEIPFDITGRHLVLVDDVLYTGRTGRAALDALMDLGRPASVRLLVIVDRGHRELPLAADIVGRAVPTLPGEMVRVRLSEVDAADGVWLVEAGDTPGEAASR
jgi:pyrimidine operon attenuation protein/uracil phosphoribosyltransferase